MIKLIRYLKPFVPLLVLSVILLFLQVNLDLSLPDLMSRIVNVGIRNPDGNPFSVQNGYILEVGGRMLLMTLVSAGSAILVGLFASRISTGVARDLRLDIFARVEGFTRAEFDRFSTASLITRTTNDVTQIQQVTFMLVRMAIYAPLMGLGGVFRAVGKAPSMAWIIGVAVLFLLGMIFVAYLALMPKFKITQKLMDRLNRVARENLTGLMVVRAFNRQSFEEKRFDDANRDLTAVNLYILRMMVSLMPLVTFIMNLLTVMVVWVGARKVADSQIQVGDMMAFLQYSIQIVMSFLMLSMVLISVPRASVSADRISEILQVRPEILDPAEPSDPPSGTGVTLDFKNVSFRYPQAEDDALSGIGFTARPGTVTAIIGPTGSGKSTLVNLIPRFYDVTAGEILVNGTDIRQYRQKDLRALIGYVPQKSVLFTGTIAGNLRYADENAGADAVNGALELSQSAEFVHNLDLGLEAPVSQGGDNFSGGQKQRLSIARALVRQNPVLIFDDCFSALDFQTDRNLRQALKGNSAGQTLIIVAQRVSTIMNADQIIVLDNGRIEGIGRHDELMDTCPTYREISRSQLGNGEAAV